MESNWVDFKTIKQAVTIVPVLDRYGVKLKKSGKELRGRCPIHRGDGADSFHVSTEKNVFHCFSCQAKGNVLDLVAAVDLQRAVGDDAPRRRRIEQERTGKHRVGRDGRKGRHRHSFSKRNAKR